MYIWNLWQVKLQTMASRQKKGMFGGNPETDGVQLSVGIECNFNPRVVSSVRLISPKQSHDGDLGTTV